MWLTSARPVLTWESFIASRTACMKYLSYPGMLSGFADSASLKQGECQGCTQQCLISLTTWHHKPARSFQSPAMPTSWLMLTSNTPLSNRQDCTYA